MKIFGLNYTENSTLNKTPSINKLFMDFSQMANTSTRKFGGRLWVWLKVGCSA
jgi:hypothetical protein